MKVRMPMLLKAFVAVSYVLLLAPLAIVVAVSFGASATYAFPPRELTLGWYRAFFANREFVHAFFGVSLVLGIVAAALASLLGIFAAIGLVRFRFRGRQALEAFFVAPLFIPEILFGAALYLTYARLGIKPSMMSLLCAHVVICAPFVVRIVMAGLAGLDPQLEEAAVCLGASRVQAFLKVALPLIQSSLISGFIFAFIISFSDINLALFIAGPNSTTLPVYIFNLLLFEADPSVAAASTLQILSVGLLIWLVQYLFRPRTLL
jgi:ABC-type spermidine/putrescine transport system permease subunit II